MDVEQYSHIEETYGWEVFDGLLRQAGEGAAADGRDGLRDGGLRRGQPGRRLRLLRLHHPRGGRGAHGSACSARRARSRSRCAEPSTRPSVPGSTSGSGSSSATPSSGRTRRCGWSGSSTALCAKPIDIATTKEEERQGLLRETFNEILRKGRIRTVYQPIFNLEHDGALRSRGADPGPVGHRRSRAPSCSSSSRASTRPSWELEQLCLQSSATRYHAGKDASSSSTSRRTRSTSLPSRGPSGVRAAVRGSTPPGRAGGHGAHGDPRRPGLPRGARDAAGARLPDRHRRRRLRLRLAPVHRGAPAELPQGGEHPRHRPSRRTRSSGTSSRCS